MERHLVHGNAPGPDMVPAELLVDDMGFLRK